MRWLIVWLAIGSAAFPALAQTDRGRNDTIAACLPSIVQIIAFENDHGRLRFARAASGTIVSKDGAILTTQAILQKPTGEFYDLFWISMFRGPDSSPQITCAGFPAHAIVNNDLAIVKCERDLNGNRFTQPEWPAIPLGDSEYSQQGTQLWVLGYTDGARPHISSGLVSGFTSERREDSRHEFLKTDAAIHQGNSGGAVVDESGHLIGIATADRKSQVASPNSAAARRPNRIGLILPLESAASLLAPLRASEASNSLKKDYVDGVMAAGQVLEAGNGQPIAGAVVIFRAIDQAIPTVWATTNGRGNFRTMELRRDISYRMNIVRREFDRFTFRKPVEFSVDAPFLSEFSQPFYLHRKILK